MSLHSLDPVIKGLDLLTEKTGQAIKWLTLVTVILSFAIVLLRYGFSIGSVAMQESVLYLHAAVFMLGAAYTYKHDGHVRVDIFYQKFSQRKQAWVNLFGVLLLLLPTCFAIFFLCFDYVISSWHILEKSPEAGGLPIVYISKSLLLIAPVLLIIQGLAEAARAIVIIKSSQSEESN